MSSSENNFTHNQKLAILKNIINMLNELHHIDNPIRANKEDCLDNYIEKTFHRLEKVKSLVPFANDSFIRINGHFYKNVFSSKEFLTQQIAENLPDFFHIIHGDPTFSNILLRTETVEPALIDPRGYFGKTLIYGDKDYDFAKLYYSLAGNYDQFNRKKFSLDIQNNNVEIHIQSNGWEDMKHEFFNLIGKKKNIKLSYYTPLYGYHLQPMHGKIMIQFVVLSIKVY